MSDILYSKLRLEVPSALNGENATITSERGNSRVVQMTSPITDIMLAGMEKYRVQGGTTDESVLFGYGQIKKMKLKTIIHLTTPDFEVNSATVLNNAIYMLGEKNSPYEGTSSYYGLHKYNSDGTISLITTDFPSNMTNNGVYNYTLAGFNNALYAYYGKTSSSSSSGFKHSLYKITNLDGIPVFTEVSTSSLTYTNAVNAGASPVVYNGSLHYIGENTSSTNKSGHVRVSNSDSVSGRTNPPFDCGYGRATLYNNSIYAVGQYSYSNKLYVYTENSSGTGTWTEKSNKPSLYETTKNYGDLFVLNNELHIVGGFGDSLRYHQKLVGTTWNTLDNLPFDFNYIYNKVVVWNNNGKEQVVVFDSNNSNFIKTTIDGINWSDE